VTLEPWGPGDHALLTGLLGDPAMMRHLGGPESPGKILDRQRRYAAADSRQYKIVADGEGAGWVGYWERSPDIWETGWSVLPAFQGRGLATAGTALLVELARAEGTRRWLYAYPSVDNGPSNAVCRKLGFELTGSTSYEYPPGSGATLRCNDWRLDLLGEPG
jgi:RimJ/RimL family protein N-acetyltransferase